MAQKFKNGLGYGSRVWLSASGIGGCSSGCGRGLRLHSCSVVIGVVNDSSIKTTAEDDEQTSAWGSNAPKKSPSTFCLGPGLAPGDIEGGV